MHINIIKPSAGKLFANANETELYSALILSDIDSIKNYHEVDELTEIIIDDPIDENEEELVFKEPEIELHPDEEGKISYEEANLLLSHLSRLTKRMIELTDVVNNLQT